eukprot:1109438-Amphidinium_carterae.1
MKRSVSPLSLRQLAHLCKSCSNEPNKSAQASLYKSKTAFAGASAFEHTQTYLEQPIQFCCVFSCVRHTLRHHPLPRVMATYLCERTTKRPRQTTLDWATASQGSAGGWIACTVTRSGGLDEAAGAACLLPTLLSRVSPRSLYYWFGLDTNDAKHANLAKHVRKKRQKECVAKAESVTSLHAGIKEGINLLGEGCGHVHG